MNVKQKLIAVGIVLVGWLTMRSVAKNDVVQNEVEH